MTRWLSLVSGVQTEFWMLVQKERHPDTYGLTFVLWIGGGREFKRCPFLLEKESGKVAQRKLSYRSLCEHEKGR